MNNAVIRESLSPARELIKYADIALDAGELEGAAWRLADAMSIIAGLRTHNKVLGIDLYTGMGARLDSKGCPHAE